MQNVSDIMIRKYGTDFNCEINNFRECRRKDKMKTELTIEESLKREKGMIFPQDFSEKTLLAVAHSHNCINALKKQIPIRPITYTGTNRADCPVCGATVRWMEKPWGDWCSNCGQRLDWTEN